MKCPKCESKQLFLDDCFDTETKDDNTIYEWWSGECENCHCSLIIKRTFILVDEEVRAN